MSVLPPEPLSRLLEGREADGVAAEAERGVDVLHEAVAEEPDVAAETEVLAGESTHTLLAAAAASTSTVRTRLQVLHILEAARRAEVEAARRTVSICNSCAAPNKSLTWRR